MQTRICHCFQRGGRILNYATNKEGIVSSHSERGQRQLLLQAHLMYRNNRPG